METNVRHALTFHYLRDEYIGFKGGARDVGYFYGILEIALIICSSVAGQVIYRS